MVSKLWAAHQASLQQSGPGDNLMMSCLKSVATPKKHSKQSMGPFQPSCCWSFPMAR